MLLVVGDNLIWIEITIFQLLVMTSTLESISGSNELGHFFVELANPSFLFGSHLILVEFDIGNIFSVFYFAPFSVLLARNVFLLLFRTFVAFLADMAQASWLKLLAAIHFIFLINYKFSKCQSV